MIIGRDQKGMREKVERKNVHKFMQQLKIPPTELLASMRNIFLPYPG